MKRAEKIKEFLRMSKEGLVHLLKEKKEKLRELRFDLSSGKVKNVREIRGIKRDIARIATLVKAKSI
ncbi:MAG: 50S ribosomal protein L29 [Patescibacteria group bacterium]|nr:50S ribosomal protein L29 [Patescibacteria group bacterium]